MITFEITEIKPNGDPSALLALATSLVYSQEISSGVLNDEYNEVKWRISTE